MTRTTGGEEVKLKRHSRVLRKDRRSSFWLRREAIHMRRWGGKLEFVEWVCSIGKPAWQSVKYGRK